MLLTAAAVGLRGYQQKNIRIDKQKNILKAVGLVDAQQKYSSAAIEKLYSDNIHTLWVDGEGLIFEPAEKEDAHFPIYLYRKNDRIEAYIVPIESRGLWGKILGYLAIKNDGRTIAGFAVYKHSETPGLGGEIEKQWFQKNFKGKKIVNRDGTFVSISITKGKVKDRVPESRQMNYVDGISGATLTSRYLTEGIKKNLEVYEPVSVRFREENKPAGADDGVNSK
jgi:Na+-transporting NADH:ubiquinone oxidoreductase subunit C